MRQILLSTVLLASLTACRREAPVEGPVPFPIAGRVVINEIAVNGAQGDWIELYNPGPVFTLEAGSWYITDDPVKEPLLFELPELEVPAQGHVVVWCDKDELTAEGVHAGFGLGRKGCDLALYWTDGLRTAQVDAASVGGTTADDASYGRVPDGSMQWATLTATPGASNGEVLTP